MNVTQAKHLPFPLGEAGQVNPLRWHILYKQEDGSFEDQSGVFKCKDYFNDIVALYKGLKFAVHGFDTRKIKLNEEGVYILLSNLTSPVSLIQNIKLISGEAEKYGYPAIPVNEESKDVFLFIDRKYFESTYIISWLTYLIRIAHCGKGYDTYEEFASQCPMKDIDVPMGVANQKKAFELSFKQPVEGWYYFGKSFNKELTQSTVSGFSYAIHDNGVSSWHQKLACNL